jgi:hypothetical protein
MLGHVWAHCCAVLILPSFCVYEVLFVRLKLFELVFQCCRWIPVLSPIHGRIDWLSECAAVERRPAW